MDSLCHFFLTFQIQHFLQVYKNVSNVVVRISWTDETLPGSITDYDLTPLSTHTETHSDNDFAVLVNAHFDSIPGSPGAADDGIGVACMIEVLRILAHGPRLKHPIILLFNGAEEGNHQAAHGFITQHRWAPQVKYVFNLEAIGSGGQEMMFQCNSGWLAAFYGKMAPHPHASVMAHELFKHLLHRMASTDWSTLMKYGSPGIRGIDTAYIQNGYVYHTTFDTADIVPSKSYCFFLLPALSSIVIIINNIFDYNIDGTLVNTGENILYLAKALASSPEVPNFTQQDHQDELSVFFDLGGVLFVYTGVKVTIIHTLVALLCVALVYALSRSVSNLSATKLRHFLLAELYAYLMPILAGALFGLVVFFVCPMRWYEGGLKWAVLLYVPPVLLTILHVRGQTSAGVLNTPQIRIMTNFLFPWLFWLVPGILFGVMSVYVCCLWILNVALAVGVHTLVRHYTLRHAHPPTRYMYSPEFFYLLTLLPMLYLWSTVARLFLTMTIPLLGKSGTTVPTDPAVGALIGALLSGPAPLVLAYNIDRPVLNKTSLRASLAALGVILLIATVLTTPYSAERPKRLWIQHLHRSFVTHPQLPHSTNTAATTASLATSPSDPIVHTDCGLWISAFDEQGMAPLQSIGVGRLDGRHKSSNDCTVWD
ncbi:MAG: M20/M25/M40 family metallo-hydrolase, partial [Burkholderiaceae bacterium]